MQNPVGNDRVLLSIQVKTDGYHNWTVLVAIFSQKR